MAFEAQGASGKSFLMDASDESVGGRGLGPTPVEALIGSMAACSAMDVISILRKKQQVVTSYRVEVDSERSPEAAGYPRPFTEFVIRHIVVGENLDEAAVKRAVELSDEKYCTVVATLREAPQITSTYRIEEAEPAR